MIQFSGYQNLTLQDYPDQMAAMLFTNGCNLRCPYCHNPDLALGKAEVLDGAIIDDLLTKWQQQGIEHLVITGGEPTIHGGLLPFARDLTSLGFKLKLDTNGYDQRLVAELIECGLLDYLALDIKPDLVQLEQYLPFVRFLVEQLRRGRLGGLEFRTTVTTALSSANFIEIGRVLYNNAPQIIELEVPYYLQTLVDNGNLLGEAQGYSAACMEGFANILRKYEINAIVR